MAFPEFFKTNNYISKAISEYSAITVHMDASHPKIKEEKRVVRFTRSYRDFLAGGTIASDEDEFNLSFLVAQEHQRIINNPVFDLSIYPVINISAYTLEKTPSSSLDRYDFVGSCTASIDADPAIVYDDSWLRFNRFGHVLFAQLFKTGDPTAKIIYGFLNTSNPETFMDIALEGDPAFALGGLQELIVIDDKIPILKPKKVDELNVKPTAVDDNVSDINQGGVANFTDISANDIDTDGTIDPTTVVLIDPSNGINIGFTGTPLVIVGVGTWTVDAASDVVFTPEPAFIGATTCEYTIDDNDGATSNAATLSVTVIAAPSCAEFDVGIYTFEEIDDFINIDGYVPIASQSELNLAKGNANNVLMGVGTCWEGLYTTGTLIDYILVRNLDISSDTDFIPIGRSTGSNLDGSGLTIDGLTSTLGGLTAGISNSDCVFNIRNLHLSNLDINATTLYLGGLTTRISGGNIENCTVQGSVITTGTSSGGVVGYDNILNADFNITNCHFNGTASSTGQVGGVVSYVRQESTFICTISDCTSQGVISTTGALGAGGIIGYGQANTNIIRCNSSCDVTATGIQVGSIAGRLNTLSSIVDCKGTGTLSSGGRTGGLLGSASGGPVNITNSIAINTFAGSTSNRGGLIGLGSGTITDSFWDTDVSGVATTSGTLSGTSAGETTVNLQTPISNTGIYVNWDDLVWDFGTTSDYPELI